jgi:hypothetical protein
MPSAVTGRLATPHGVAEPKMRDSQPSQLTDEQRAEQFIDDLDDNLLYCRAKRRHRYPVVLPPKPGRAFKPPKGFSFSPMHSRPGCYMIEETCEVCGRVCTTVSLPGGFRDRKAVKKYQDPIGYKAPKGTGKHLQGSVAWDELERRINESGLFGMPGQ